MAGVTLGKYIPIKKQGRIGPKKLVFNEVVIEA